MEWNFIGMFLPLFRAFLQLLLRFFMSRRGVLTLIFETSRLAGSLDFQPFSLKEIVKIDLNHQKMFWGTLKSQTRDQKMAKIVFE